MPISYLEGYELTYPVGVSDLKNFDFDEFKKIAFYMYMGGIDRSDSAMPTFAPIGYEENGKPIWARDECNNKTVYIDENGKQHFVLDENGNYTAMNNLFTDSQVNAINKTLGTVTQDRFEIQRAIYEQCGLNALFKIYEGADHRSIFNDDNYRAQVIHDITEFMKTRIPKEEQGIGLK